MTGNVTKITDAATATGSFNTVGTTPPREINSYPAFYQYGRKSSFDVATGKRKRYVVETRYRCYIVNTPGTTVDSLDALRDSFLGALADEELQFTRVESDQYRLQIGTDECPVDVLDIVVTDDQHTVA